MSEIEQVVLNVRVRGLTHLT